MPAASPLVALLSQPAPRSGPEIADVARRAGRRRSAILIGAALPFVLLGGDCVRHPQNPPPWIAFALFGVFSLAIVAFWLSQLRAISKLLRAGLVVPATITRRLIGARGAYRVHVEFELDAKMKSFNSIIPYAALPTETAAGHVLLLPDERLACVMLANDLHALERFR